MGARDGQGLGRLLPHHPTHKETVYVFCLPKNLCALLKPVCPELLTINTQQPVLQVTSPLVNEQGVTDEAPYGEKPQMPTVSWTPLSRRFGKKSFTLDQHVALG